MRVKSPVLSTISKMSVSCFWCSVFQIDNLWGLGCGIEAAHYAIEKKQIPLTRPGLLLKVCVIVWGQLFLLCLSNLKPSFSLAPFSALLASGHFLGGISGSGYFIQQSPKGYLFSRSVMVWQTHLSRSDLPEGKPLRISWQMMHQREEERPCFSAVPVSQRASEEHSAASSISEPQPSSCSPHCHS